MLVWLDFSYLGNEFPRASSAPCDWRYPTVSLFLIKHPTTMKSISPKLTNRVAATVSLSSHVSSSFIAGNVWCLLPCERKVWLNRRIELFVLLLRFQKVSGLILGPQFRNGWTSSLMIHLYMCSYLNIHNALYITWQVSFDNCLIMSNPGGTYE